jgi:hypothetical protein
MAGVLVRPKLFRRHSVRVTVVAEPPTETTEKEEPKENASVGERVTDVRRRIPPSTPTRVTSTAAVEREVQVKRQRVRERDEEEE